MQRITSGRITSGLLLSACLLASAQGADTTAVAALAPLGPTAPLCASCELAKGFATYTDSVFCDEGRCQPLRKTVPLDLIIEQDAGGGLCIQYRQRLTGFRRVPSNDSLQPIEVPQFENDRMRQVLCAPERARRALGLNRSSLR